MTTPRYALLPIFALAVGLIAPAPALAQDQVTLVKRDGSRISGRFEDWHRPSNRLFVRVSQNDQQQVGLNDALVLEVGGGADNLPEAETKAAAGGDRVLVLRNGDVLVGQLLNIEGGEGSQSADDPRIVSFKPNNGDERRVRMNEVRRLYFGNYPQQTTASASVQELEAQGGEVRVPANQRWVSTGIVLPRNARVSFDVRGEILLSSDGEDKAVSAGSLRGRKATGAPLPELLAGAIIARVGTGPLFAIGNNTAPITPPGNGGELMLTVNDDELSDNQGAFLVNVRVQRRR